MCFVQSISFILLLKQEMASSIAKMVVGHKVKSFTKDIESAVGLDDDKEQATSEFSREKAEEQRRKQEERRQREKEIYHEEKEYERQKIREKYKLPDKKKTRPSHAQNRAHASRSESSEGENKCCIC